MMDFPVVKKRKMGSVIQMDLLEIKFAVFLQNAIKCRKAKAFLIEAFCKEMLEKVKTETIKEALLEDAQILSTA